MFGVLRWLGISENNQGITLKWITEDGAIQIAANIQGTALNIEAKFLNQQQLEFSVESFLSAYDKYRKALSKLAHSQSTL